MRKETVLNSLKENGIDLKNVECIIGRGGLLKPIEGGVYAINDRIIEDSTVGVQGEHPCNLGALLAKNLAEVNGVPSFIADPGIVDELDPLARYSGMPENPRISLFHALNQKRVARMALARIIGFALASKKDSDDNGSVNYMLYNIIVILLEWVLSLFGM